MGPVAEVQELSGADAEAFIEEQVQHWLGMTRDEFVRRASAGNLPDHAMVGYLMLLTGANDEQLPGGNEAGTSKDAEASD